MEELIHKAYDSLKEGDSEAAQALLRQAMKIDFEHQEVLYALKCLNWWLEKLKRLDHYHDSYGRGEYILSQWKSYYDFLERMENVHPSLKEGQSPGRETHFQSREDSDSCQYAIKCFVYTRSLEYYLDLLKDGANQQDPALLLQAGRCYKGAGNWGEALKYLEQASRYKREDSAILSELADVNALLGDSRAAKVLFREAFFLEPQGVTLNAMESEMILALRDKVIELGHIGTDTAEWMPVWGCIWGIFSVKRALKPVELGRLKQSILSLENEFRSKSGGNELIKPRLLNRYFWLIDHYEHNGDTSGMVNETLLKIQLIDPVVHKQYRP